MYLDFLFCRYLGHLKNSKKSWVNDPDFHRSSVSFSYFLWPCENLWSLSFNEWLQHILDVFLPTVYHSAFRR